MDVDDLESMYADVINGLSKDQSRDPEFAELWDEAVARVARVEGGRPWDDPPPDGRGTE
jgi:hypothetical protein